VDYTYEHIAKMIDHSLVHPVLTDAELDDGCRIALQYDVASVCIKPYYLRRCAELLAGSTVAPSTVIGFPHGGNATAVKLAETEQALADGGIELDMVANVGKVLSGDWDYVRQDIGAVVQRAHAAGAKVKVIFENCYLRDDHKVRLCEICGEVNADWVKTSTGFATGGATLDDLRLMRAHAPPHVQVKAAGGIRTFAALLEVRAAGATRCGATRTIEMLEACKRATEHACRARRPSDRRDRLIAVPLLFGAARCRFDNWEPRHPRSEVPEEPATCRLRVSVQRSGGATAVRGQVSSEAGGPACRCSRPGHSAGSTR
jgi:deoxyribose-phosphate aldolase